MSGSRNLALTVERVIRRTETIVSIRLVGDGRPGFVPGQFFKVYAGNGTLWRHLSASCSPARPYIEFTKRLTGSPFSRALEGAREGSVIAVEGPMGRFTASGRPEKLLLIAGGIGITPFMSILDDAYLRRETRDTVLLFSNSSVNETPFRVELDEYSRILPLRVVFFCREGGEGFVAGRIDRGRIETLVPDAAGRLCLIAGPPAMVKSLKDQVSGIIPRDNLLTEQLAGYEEAR